MIGVAKLVLRLAVIVNLCLQHGHDSGLYESAGVIARSEQRQPDDKYPGASVDGAEQSSTAHPRSAEENHGEILK